ncbi:MAG: hypothetical protein R3B45_10390 [Bdellovibrionota bacterium]
MIASLQNLEKKLLNSSKLVQLPPTWQVIYEEAIRGNHILFSRIDSQVFKEESFQCWNLSSSELSKIEEIIFKVLSASTFSEMVEIISAHESRVRYSLFLVYQRIISLWSQYLKKSLH